MTNMIGRPGTGQWKEWRKCHIAPRTHPLRPVVFCNFSMDLETKGLLDFQGRRGITSVVWWTIRPVTFSSGKVYQLWPLVSAYVFCLFERQKQHIIVILRRIQCNKEGRTWPQKNTQLFPSSKQNCWQLAPTWLAVLWSVLLQAAPAQLLCLLPLLFLLSHLAVLAAEGLRQKMLWALAADMADSPHALLCHASFSATFCEPWSTARASGT